MTTRVRPSLVALVAVLFAVTTAAGCAVPFSGPFETLPAESVSQQNARETAQDHLQSMAFSRNGLILQLTSEGFASADAVYAVDSLDVNWNEQAALKGTEYTEYLASSALSRRDLFEMLLLDGFTWEQAEYGVNASYGEDGDGTSQRNAVEQAREYLEYSSRSRSGLIEMLELAGFSKVDAVYAVDSLDVNWNEQAAKQGTEYLESSSFSRQGLLDQLLLDGFTPEQAEYGVNASYGEDGDGTSQRNAVEQARGYLEYLSFSRSGLIEMLEFEGFSNVDAVYAVDSLDVNWNEQAALKAESYLETSSFTRQELLDQLLFEGFTAEQAEYGVDSVGL